MYQIKEEKLRHESWGCLGHEWNMIPILKYTYEIRFQLWNVIIIMKYVWSVIVGQVEADEDFQWNHGSDQENWKYFGS